MLTNKEIKRFKLSTVQLQSARDLESFLVSIGAELVYAGVPGRAAEKIVNDFIFKKRWRGMGVLLNGRAAYITGADGAVRDLAVKAASICLKRGLL